MTYHYILKMIALALSLTYAFSMTAKARRGLYRISSNDEEFAASSSSREYRINKPTKVAVHDEQKTMFDENSRA
jgi:hypothetical protein